MRGSARHKAAFLESFRRVGNVTKAARDCGIARRTIYLWQEHDDTFAAAFREADVEATETLEAEAHRRAVEGVESSRPIYGRDGELLDTVTEIKYSDTLLMFLLKARAPEKYRDRHDWTSGGEKLDLAALVLLAAGAAEPEAAA